MFSIRECKLLELNYKVARVFGAAPFSFDIKSQLVSIDHKAIPNLKFKFNLNLLWEVIAFSIVIKRWLTNDTDNFHLTVAWWLGFSVILLVYSISRFLYEELCELINSLFIWLQFIKNTYMPSFDPDNVHGIFLFKEIAVMVVDVACFGLFLGTILYIAIDPTGVIFVGGLIPSRFFSLPVSLASIIFHVYADISLVASLSFVCIQLIECFVLIYFFINCEFRIGRNAYLTEDHLRSPANLRVAFRSTQIIQQIGLRSCFLGLYLVILNALVVMSGVYITFALIRFWKDFNLVTKAPMLIGNIICLGYWTLLLEFGCLFHVSGTKTLNSWKIHDWGSIQQNKEMKRFLKSCKPLIISYGRQFVIGRVSILNFYRSVTRGTCRALLTMK